MVCSEAYKKRRPHTHPHALTHAEQRQPPRPPFPQATAAQGPKRHPIVRLTRRSPHIYSKLA
jgi:hypothetical protein